MDGLQSVTNIDPILKVLERQNVKDLIYHFLLQTSADMILLEALDGSAEDVEILNGPSYGGRVCLVEPDRNRCEFFAELCRYVWKNYKQEHCDTLSNAIFFLSDAFLAIKQGGPLVSLLGVPDKQDLAAVPGDLAQHLSLFVSQIETLKASSVGFDSQAAIRDVQIVYDILSQRLFREGFEIKSELTKEKVDKEKILSFLRSNTNALLAKFPSFLKQKDVLIKLSAPLSGVIDSAFGALPSKLFDLVVSVGTNTRSSSDKLIVYSYEDKLLSIFLKRMEDMAASLPAGVRNSSPADNISAAGK